MQDDGTKQATNHYFTFNVLLDDRNSTNHVAPYVRIEVNNLWKEMCKKAVLNSFKVQVRKQSLGTEEYYERFRS
jgi:predicted RNA-binding protein YlxR (DUF448 family)